MRVWKKKGSQNYDSYKQYKNKFTCSLKNAKRDYFEKTTTKNANFSKRLWQKLKNRYILNIQQSNDPTSFLEQWRNTSEAITYCQ